MRRTELEPDLLFLEVAHDAARAVQPECAPARQHDRVSDLDEVDGIEHVGFASGWSRTAHVHRGCCAGFGQHDRAAGRTFGERRMANLDPRHRRQRGVDALLREGRRCRERRKRRDDRQTEGWHRLAIL